MAEQVSLSKYWEQKVHILVSYLSCRTKQLKDSLISIAEVFPAKSRNIELKY